MSLLQFKQHQYILDITLPYSDWTPEGRRVTHLDRILLNGNNITMVCHQSNVHLLFELRSLHILTFLAIF